MVRKNKAAKPGKVPKELLVPAEQAGEHAAAPVPVDNTFAENAWQELCDAHFATSVVHASELQEAEALASVQLRWPDPLPSTLAHALICVDGADAAAASSAKLKLGQKRSRSEAAAAPAGGAEAEGTDAVDAALAAPAQQHACRPVASMQELLRSKVGADSSEDSVQRSGTSSVSKGGSTDTTSDAGASGADRPGDKAPGSGAAHERGNRAEAAAAAQLGAKRTTTRKARAGTQQPSATSSSSACGGSDVGARQAAQEATTQDAVPASALFAKLPAAAKGGRRTRPRHSSAWHQAAREDSWSPSDSSSSGASTSVVSSASSEQPASGNDASAAARQYAALAAGRQSAKAKHHRADAPPQGSATRVAAPIGTARRKSVGQRIASRKAQRVSAGTSTLPNPDAELAAALQDTNGLPGLLQDWALAQDMAARKRAPAGYKDDAARIAQAAIKRRLEPASAATHDLQAALFQHACEITRAWPQAVAERAHSGEMDDARAHEGHVRLCEHAASVAAEAALRAVCGAMEQAFLPSKHAWTRESPLVNAAPLHHPTLAKEAATLPPLAPTQMFLQPHIKFRPAFSHTGPSTGRNKDRCVDDMLPASLRATCSAYAVKLPPAADAGNTSPLRSLQAAQQRLAAALQPLQARQGVARGVDGCVPPQQPSASPSFERAIQAAATPAAHVGTAAAQHAVAAKPVTVAQTSAQLLPQAVIASLLDNRADFVAVFEMELLTPLPCAAAAASEEAPKSKQSSKRKASELCTDEGGGAEEGEAASKAAADAAKQAQPAVGRYDCVEVSTLCPSVLFPFFRWPRPGVPPTLLYLAKRAAAPGFTLKAMRCWLRRVRNTSSEAQRAQRRLCLLTQAGLSAAGRAALGSSSFAACGAVSSVGTAHAAATAADADTLYTSAAAAGLTLPPPDRPELLPACVAQHWSSALPFALHLHHPCSSLQSAARLAQPPRTRVRGAAQRGPAHNVVGCESTQPYVAPVSAETGVQACSDAAAGRIADSVGSGAASGVAGSAAKLHLSDLPHAVASGHVWLATKDDAGRYKQWLEAAVPASERPSPSGTEFEVARDAANAARAARGLPPGNWRRGCYPGLSAAEEARIAAGLAFGLPALDGIDIMALAAQGAVALNTAPKQVHQLIKLFTQVQASHLGALAGLQGQPHGTETRAGAELGAGVRPPGDARVVQLGSSDCVQALEVDVALMLHATLGLGVPIDVIHRAMLRFLFHKRLSKAT